MTHNQIMEKMNQDIPFEHQMLFIIRDYDRKVEENMELRKEVEELSAALEKQGAELKKAKKKLKSWNANLAFQDGAATDIPLMPSLNDKALQLKAAKRKNEKLTKQASCINAWSMYATRYAICWQW